MMQLITRCRFLHPYYPQGLLQDCELQASSETARLMHRYTMSWRKNQTGFELYCQHAQSDELLAYLQSCYPSEELQWNLIGDKAHFCEITESDSNTLLQFDLRLDTSSDTTSSWLNLKPDTTLAYPRTQALASLRCHFADLKNAYLRQNNFQYEFQARKLHWVYLLINRSQQELQQPQIVLNNQVSFAEPELVQLENGEQALRFSALAGSYLFQQENQPQFDLQVESSLVLAGQRQKQILLKGLPTPQPGMLSIRRQSDHTQVVSSEMYVYI